MILHAVVDELETARAALAGGATVVQLRLKGLGTAALVERGRPFRQLCSAAGATFVVNDDADAAVELRADGVHLGAEDDGIERARKEGLLLGLSAQTLPEALLVAKERPDYIGAGPVWATPTKPAAPVMGLDGLARVCASVDVPVIAIGGVNASTAPLCLDAGAAGVAVVRAAARAAEIRAAIERAAV